MKMIKRPLSDQRGTVMVLTAAALFPIMFLAAFVIDVSHWFDYSRNLQNRADAAALSAGASFGNICLNGSTGGDVRTGAQAVLGEYAQLYSGAGTGEPSGANNTQLPYTNAQVAAGTGWNVTQNGYINNTTAASPLVSPLTLKFGKLNDYWVVLNGNNYAENGGTSFSMTSTGTGATFCSSDPKYDLTDPQRASAGAAGPMVDVKVTQKRLPLFFQSLPGFANLHPTLHAHARVELQGEASSPSEPIAVSDNGYVPCVTVKFFKTSDPLNPIGTAVLTKEPQPLQTDPIIWDNATVQLDSNGNPIPNTGPTPVTMPAAGDNVYIQPYLNNCQGSGTTYDDSTNSGVLLINTYTNAATPVDPQPPVITTGGVTLNDVNCAPDQFFSNVPLGGTCKVQVTAHVAFSVANNKSSVTAVDTNTGQTLPLNGSGTTWTAQGNQSLTVADSDGQHLIRIDWEQNAGTITGLGTCTTNATNPCKGTFGIRAQAFGACNGCAQPDDSGPIILAQVRKDTDGVGAFGPNAYLAGSMQNLVVTLQLAGLNAAPATATAADDVVLRYPTSGNHQTGLIDCGQGTNGAYGDYVVYGGCGPGNPYIGNPLPVLNPIYMYTRTNNSGCSPAQDGNTTGWPSGNHQDCVATIPGTRNPICPLVLKMTGEPLSAQPCNFNLGTCGNPAVRPCCPTNAWPNVQGNDPRAVTMIITSGVDFSAASGPQGWVPVRRFATFYVTGWDSRVSPNCAGNDPFPARGKNNSQNEAIWGHWMIYSDTAGTSNGQQCPVSSVQPVNCVPALTR
jgi:Flp pilus assembly protein TadG